MTASLVCLPRVGLKCGCPAFVLSAQHSVCWCFPGWAHKSAVSPMPRYAQPYGCGRQWHRQVWKPRKPRLRSELRSRQSLTRIGGSRKLLMHGAGCRICHLPVLACGKPPAKACSTRPKAGPKLPSAHRPHGRKFYVGLVSEPNMPARLASVHLGWLDLSTCSKRRPCTSRQAAKHSCPQFVQHVPQRQPDVQSNSGCSGHAAPGHAR